MKSNMFKRIISALFLLTVFMLSAYARTQPKETGVFTVQPAMHCENCEKKIKSNLRFEKGVSEIAVDRKAQIITVTFNPEKTSEKKLIEAFRKIGYKATPVNEKNDE